MKIAIIGATGSVGQRLVDEALSRRHEVTAVARNPSTLPASEQLQWAAADARHPSELAAALKGHDAVVSSVGFRMVEPAPLIEAVRRSGVKRYLVVGGAGSLEVAPGKLLVDSPEFPVLHKAEALAGKAFLDALLAVDDLDWTMLCPSALFSPGQRTGKFRLGGDALLSTADGKSGISCEDYAIALLDEIEQPAHIQRRFTVGY